MHGSSPPSPGLENDPEAYIKASESRFPDIRPGAEKQIVWAHADKRRTELSIIYLHGFSASAGEIRPVPDLVAKHIQANLFFTRLAGHGIDGSALGDATLEEWLDDVAEAFAVGRAIGERVIVLAVSTGAALATWAMTQPDVSRNVAAAVLFSPNFGLKASGSFLLGAPFARQIVRAVLGRTRQAEARNELQRRVWTATYPTDALLTLAKAIYLSRKAKVELVTTPALFFYSPDDKVVDPRPTLKIAARWGGPHQVRVVSGSDDPNAHVLAGDAYSPSTTQSAFTQICVWLDETLQPNS